MCALGAWTPARQRGHDCPEHDVERLPWLDRTLLPQIMEEIMDDMQLLAQGCVPDRIVAQLLIPPMPQFMEDIAVVWNPVERGCRSRVPFE